MGASTRGADAVGARTVTRLGRWGTCPFRFSSHDIALLRCGQSSRNKQRISRPIQGLAATVAVDKCVGELWSVAPNPSPGIRGDGSQRGHLRLASRPCDWLPGASLHGVPYLEVHDDSESPHGRL